MPRFADAGYVNGKRFHFFTIQMSHQEGRSDVAVMKICVSVGMPASLRRHGDYLMFAVKRG